MLKARFTTKRFVGGVGALLLLAAGGGCQYPITVNSAWAPGDISPLGPTFAWMPAPATPTANPEIDNRQVRRLVRELVEEQFVAKGYANAASGTPSYRVGDRIGAEVLGDPYTAYLQQYTLGTLVIYIVNPRTDQWVWRAWAETRVNESNTPEERRERLEQTVKRMFNDFPAYGQNRPVAKP
jgi:Domain of unknown function (DUF4136)